MSRHGPGLLKVPDTWQSGTHLGNPAHVQVLSIVRNTRPDRQTLLFSATMPHKLRPLTHEALKDAVHVTIGTAGAANADVQQTVLLMANGDQKMQWLQARLRGFVDEGEVLVFVSKRSTVDALAGLVKARLVASTWACIICGAAEKAN
jgi:superfamily II DNA/RNA helicase